MELLYEYPDRSVSRQEKIRLAGERIAERKRVNKIIIKSAVLMLVLLLVCILVKFVWLKIVLAVLALGLFFTSFLFAMSMKMALDEDVYVKIFDNRIESYQPPVLGIKKRLVTINYDEVIESSQTTMGSISFLLKGNKSESIYFVDPAAKMFLIENLHDKIHYPKKEYIVFPEEDEDDPDYKWKNWKSF